MINKTFFKSLLLFTLSLFLSNAYANYFYVIDGNNQRVDFLQAQTITLMVCTGSNLTGSTNFPHTLQLLTDGRAREATYSIFSFFVGQTATSSDAQAILDTDMTSWLPQGIKEIRIVNASGQPYVRNPNLAPCSNGGNSGCCASCQFPQMITVGGTL